MILKRLFELAEREHLLDDPAFVRQPIPFVVQIGQEGEYLGVMERRTPIVVPSRKKGDPPKTRPGRGDDLLVPKAHGNTANKGFACFFADTLARVLPVSDEEKSVRSRRTFWEQIDNAAEQTSDPALRAVQAFGRRLSADTALADRVRADFDVRKPSPGDRCTFAWHPDGGVTIVERDAVRNWFRAFVASIVEDREQGVDQGICQITGELAFLPRSHSTKIAGVPGGISSGVSVVSNDKPAFESYGLDGAINAGVGARAADGYTRALNDLAANKLPGRPTTSRRLGDVLFLFWTREKQDMTDLMQLDRPEPEQVRRLIESAERGRAANSASANQFYCLSLSGNAARAIVRDYLEAPVPDIQVNLGRWFRDLRIIHESSRELTSAFPLWALANSTVRDSKDLAPDLITVLNAAALKAVPLPDSVLAACLRRIRVETGPAQFAPARMGLIKLILNRSSATGVLLMTEQLDPNLDQRSRGYASGRLLAFLARCQSPRDYGAGAQILERYFGAASTAPRSVFPVLLRLNRHHLRKIRDEMAGFAFNLEAELEERLAPFKPDGDGDPDFPAILSLHEQGRFALGFYHQRAAYRTTSADRKAANQLGAQ